MDRGRHLHPAVGPELRDDVKQREDFGTSFPSSNASEPRILYRRENPGVRSRGLAGRSSRQSSPSGIYRARIPRTTGLSSSPSQGGSPTTKSWYHQDLRRSESACLTKAKASFEDGVNREVNESKEDRFREASTESCSSPAARSRRGSERSSKASCRDKRQSSANVSFMILDDGTQQCRHRRAWSEDPGSDIMIDSNELGLDVDRRQISDRVINQEEGSAVAAVRRRVRSLQARERQISTSTGFSRVLTGHGGQVLSLARHEDILFSAAADGTAKAWDIHTRRCLATYEGHRKPVWGLQVKGQTLVTGSADGTVRFWDVMTTQLLHTMDLRLPVRDIVVVGELLAVATSSANIDVIDLNSMTRQSTLVGHIMAVASLTSFDDGKRLASGSHDTFIRVWNPGTGTCDATLEGHSGTVGALSSTCFLPSDRDGGATAQERGESIVSGSGDATVRVWRGSSREEMEVWACIAVLESHRHGVWAVHGSPFSDVFVSGGGDASVHVWASTTFDPSERVGNKIDAESRRFEEGEHRYWECVGGVRGTGGAVGAVLLSEEMLYLGTSEALIATFPLQSCTPGRR